MDWWNWRQTCSAHASQCHGSQASMTAHVSMLHMMTVHPQLLLAAAAISGTVLHYCLHTELQSPQSPEPPLNF